MVSFQDITLVLLYEHARRTDDAHAMDFLSRQCGRDISSSEYIISISEYMHILNLIRQSGVQVNSLTVFLRLLNGPGYLISC